MEEIVEGYRIPLTFAGAHGPVDPPFQLRPVCPHHVGGGPIGGESWRDFPLRGRGLGASVGRRKPLAGSLL